MQTPTMFGATPLNVSLITYDIFKAEADALLRNGYYRKAIDSYTAALKLRPNDKISLVCRSKCHLLLGDTAMALHDAEASLAEDKHYHLGMFQKAEALFQKGDFEMALVFYHRGNKLRPELQNFRIGIKRAQLSIYNCVGTPDRVKLNTTGDLSFFAAHTEKKSKRKGQLCTYTPQIVERGKRAPRSHNEKTIKQMLGDLYGDRDYLEHLLRDIDIRSKTGRRINSYAEHGLTYLDKLAEFWQQVNPIYARQYESRLALNRGRSLKIAAHDYIYGEIQKIETVMAECNYEGALQRSQKVLSLLDGYTENQLSSKMIFVANLSSIMGNVYLELNDMENAEKYHKIDLGIGEERCIDLAEFRALDNLGRVYARCGKFRKAIEMWERKLPFSKTPVETAWLCHELGRCYLELDNTQMAKEYAEKSLAAAEEAYDDRWKLHAFVLISQADVKSGRLSSALITFEKALELASLLMDLEARDVIAKAVEDVNDKIIEKQFGAEYKSLMDIMSAIRRDQSDDPEETAGKVEEKQEINQSSSHSSKPVPPSEVDED